MARTEFDARSKLKRSREELEEQYEEDELEHDNDWGELDREEGGEGDFTIRDAVPDKQTIERTCYELHDMMHQGHIELNAPYQRDIVWKPDRQSALIDSLFKGLHVPPVVFAVRPDPESDIGMTYICVDGKQRLTAVQGFIDSQIPHIDPVTKKKFYMPLNLSDKSGKKKVPHKYVEMFHNIKIACVEYGNIDEATEREIFERVQNGVPLQVAEKLQALNGPLVRWFNELQSKYVSSDETGLQKRITWSVGRGKDFECIARSSYVISQMPAHVFPSQQALNKWLKTSPDPCEQFKEGISDVLASFVKIASDARYTTAFTKIKERVAPVEFVFICLLLAKMRDCTLAEKADQVYNLRKTLRDKHKSEVKANSHVCKSAFAFVAAVADLKHVNWPVDEALRVTGSARGGIGSRNTPKRRRGNKGGGDDDDDDYHPNRR